MTTLPVTVERAKTHLRVDHDHEDGLIGDLILAAAERCEHILGREIIGTSSTALASSAEGVPAAVRQWILCEVTDLYERRGTSDGGSGQFRRYYDHLLDRYRIFTDEVAS